MLGENSGSWDTVSNPRGGDISFDNEEVDGFEIGVKSRLLDDTLAINLSAYKYDYSDLQTGTTSSTPDGFVIRTENAAEPMLKASILISITRYRVSSFKVGLSFFLKDANEFWEAALIGKNINNEITPGQCSLSNIQTGNLGGLATGSPANQRGLLSSCRGSTQ